MTRIYILTFVYVSLSDFVNEPVRGFKRSIEEMDPSFVMTGLARGTESLARHTLGVSDCPTNSNIIHRIASHTKGCIIISVRGLLIRQPC